MSVASWEGVGAVESWTTPFDREGQPEKVFVAVRTPDGARALAVITDTAAAQASVRDDLAGAAVAVAADGIAAIR